MRQSPKVLTDLIDQGTVTRRRRRARLGKLVAGSEQAEALAQGGAARQSSADTAEPEGMRDDLWARQKESCRMGEIQSMMAR